MARSSATVESESEVTPAGEGMLDFDDDTLRGEQKDVTSFFLKTVESHLKKILPWKSHNTGACWTMPGALNIILRSKKAKAIAKMMILPG